jgi:predicted CXXCH cytochrome family protein
MKLILSIFILLVALAHAGMASSLTMLTPPEYSSITNDHLYLVGKTGAPRVQITVNTLRQYETSTVDSVFHLYIALGYGLNEIVIRPLSEDTMMPDESTRIEILSSPYSTGRLEKLYPAYQFHSSPQEDICRECHLKESALESGTALSSMSACIECHREFSDRTLLHSGLDREECATCHNQETNQVRGAGSSASRNPCYSCHSDKIEKFNQEYIHGPVAGGSCSVCHDPHGSKFKNSLINAEEVLCFSCHEFGREFKEMPLQHRPFSEGRCGVCHDPHATSNRWVLSKSSEELCFECHAPDKEPFKNHTHPYNVKPKQRKLKSVKLSESGILECISCHNPHASMSEHLLRHGNGTGCFGCHTEKQ